MKPTRLFGALAAMFILSSAVVFAGGERECIPVRKLSEESLAFKGGENLVFTLHYNGESSMRTWLRPHSRWTPRS